MKKLYVSLGLLLVLTGVAVAIIVTKSGNKATDTAAQVPQNAVTTTAVAIQNYMFSPMAIKVKVGTTVTWTNHDQVDHTVSADTVTVAAPNSMDIAQGKSFSFKFTKAGVYTYHCFPHPYMHGTVEVIH